MKALIFAAGLGTRLKPWTLEHPKALVPVAGEPMLGRVIRSLREQGFDDVVVNVHHFAGQIKEYLAQHDFGVRIRISDESDLLLDTGGGLLHAADLLFAENEAPVLVHNVDILCNADLRWLVEQHQASGAEATLLVSDRKSSRRLVADPSGRLRGWHNVSTGEYRPSGFSPAARMTEVAFSGIHVVSAQMIERMRERGYSGVFPVMDFYLNECCAAQFECCKAEGLDLIDIGKPETLRLANDLLASR